MDFKPPDAPSPLSLTEKARKLSEKVLLLKKELREGLRTGELHYRRLYKQLHISHCNTEKELPILFAKSDLNKEKARKFLESQKISRLQKSSHQLKIKLQDSAGNSMSTMMPRFTSKKRLKYAPTFEMPETRIDQANSLFTPIKRSKTQIIPSDSAVSKSRSRLAGNNTPLTSQQKEGHWAYDSSKNLGQNSTKDMSFVEVDQLKPVSQLIQVETLKIIRFGHQMSKLQFPLKLYETRFLPMAVDDFALPITQLISLRKIAQWPEAKKVFVYLTWMFLSLKIKALQCPQHIMVQMRDKLRNSYVSLFDRIQDLTTIRALPFIIVQAIGTLIAQHIKHGTSLLYVHDDELVMMHQFVMFELCGYRVSKRIILDFQRLFKTQHLGEQPIQVALSAPKQLEIQDAVQASIEESLQTLVVYATQQMDAPLDTLVNPDYLSKILSSVEPITLNRVIIYTKSIQDSFLDSDEDLSSKKQQRSSQKQFMKFKLFKSEPQKQASVQLKRKETVTPKPVLSRMQSCQDYDLDDILAQPVRKRFLKFDNMPQGISYTEQTEYLMGQKEMALALKTAQFLDQNRQKCEFDSQITKEQVQGTGKDRPDQAAKPPRAQKAKQQLKVVANLKQIKRDYRFNIANKLQCKLFETQKEISFYSEDY